MEKKALFVEVKWNTLGEKDLKRILKSLERIAKLIGLDDCEKYFEIIGKRVSRFTIAITLF